MRAVCSLYANSRRMSLVLSKLLAKGNVLMVPTRGTAVFSDEDIKCIGEEQECLVISRGQDTPLLLSTSNSGRSLFTSETVDYDLGVRDNLYMQALLLCLDKAQRSGNSFQMECSVEGCTVLVNVTKGKPVYTLKTPQGDCQLDVPSVPEDVFKSCKSIRSFSYVLSSNSCDKEVTVRRGQLEIFREIAHFVGKSLMFVEQREVEGKPFYWHHYCVTSIGCCEMRIKDRRVTWVKVPFTRMRISPESYLYAVDMSAEDIVRAGTFMTSAICTERRCAQC